MKEEREKKWEMCGRTWPKQHLPINKKNINKPSSRMEAFNVRPKICKPFECRDNLNIRNTRTNRITRNIAKDIA